MSIRNLMGLALPALVALAVGGAAVPASAQSSTVIIAPNAPPPPRVETIPPPPSEQPQLMTWEAGHWSWNGTTWVRMAPPSPADVYLTSVSATSPSNVWVVGSYAIRTGQGS